MGKTSFALRYINGSHHQRVFIFDPEEEFAERLQLKEEQIGRGIAEVYEKAEEHRIVAYDPEPDFPGQNAEAFEFFAGCVYDMARDALCPKRWTSLLVTDELQKYVNHAYCPQSFRTCLETGRRQMLDTLSLSRAPNRVHTGVREEFTELILFRLDDSNSLKFAADVGTDVAQVATLAEHEFLYYNVLRGAERRGRVQFRERGRV